MAPSDLPHAAAQSAAHLAKMAEAHLLTDALAGTLRSRAAHAPLAMARQVTETLHYYQPSGCLAFLLPPGVAAQALPFAQWLEVILPRLAQLLQAETLVWQPTADWTNPNANSALEEEAIVIRAHRLALVLPAGTPYPDALPPVVLALSRLLESIERLEVLRQTVAQHDSPGDPTMEGLFWLNCRTDLMPVVAAINVEQQQVLEALACWLDERSGYRQGHSAWLVAVVDHLTEALLALPSRPDPGTDLPDETDPVEPDLIRQAAWLAPLGRLHLQEALWLPDAQELTRERARQAPQQAAQQAAGIYALGDVLPLVRHQGERWDGSGLPDGLKGAAIPLGARILGLVDAYVALRQARPYGNRPEDKQQGYNDAEALAILQQEAGHQWDPALVTMLCALPDIYRQPPNRLSVG